MSARLRRLAAILVLAPFVAGAHCQEDCGPPAVRLVGGRNLERTLYGPGVLTQRPRVAFLARSLGPFERREIRIDASRPIAVVLTTSDAAPGLTRLDAGALKPGDRGPGFRVVALLQQAGKVPLFDDPGQLAEAERQGWDSILLLPRDQRPGPWEAAVAVELGRRIERGNDPASGRCVEQGPGGPALPEWTLLSLPLRCGDGTRQDDEDCDDGNRRGGDGCSPYCTKER
jgi:cysteine-rich repeat protein